ncbi:hypothetical protein HDU86_004797 [Geranomyces michiganensis]|nr:hypothetical protein HDU86_004797 [Geranomyces michiganensis]
MHFSTDYTLLDQPWWTPRFVTHQSSAQLLDAISILRTKVKAGLADHGSDDYGVGYYNLHHLVYLRECLVGEAIVSDATTIEDLEDMLTNGGEGEEDARRLRNVQKARNMQKVIVQVFPTLTSTVPNTIDGFTPELFCSWNRTIGHELFANAGCYRTRGSAPAQESWVYLMPNLIGRQLDRLCEFVRLRMSTTADVLDRLKLAATFMTNFLHIHPFSNGNGRVARIAISWILIDYTVVPLPIYSSSNARVDLLDCLRVSRDSDPFIPSALARLLLEAAVKVHRNTVFALDL